MYTPRMTHIALHVDNLEDTIEFYKDFCRMNIVHQREAGTKKIVWMAEPGREQDFIFVIMNQGADLQLAEDDYRHFGFAEDAVDEVARRAERKGCLVWPPRKEPFPVGYYCGLKDPNGNYVEFSYGQPLGPGAVLAASQEIPEP